MASGVDTVLRIAKGEVGYDEGPGNRNRYAPAVGHADRQPWCASFVAWVFQQAGVKLPSTSAYTPTMYQGFVNEGRAVSPRDLKPGDVVFFRWPSMGRIAHVGIFEAYGPGGAWCIEGNTNAAGSRTGGSVLRKFRKTGLITHAGRPAYGPQAASEPSPVTSAAAAVLYHLEDDMAALVRQKDSPHVFVITGLAKRHVRTRSELNDLVKAGAVQSASIGTVSKATLDALVLIGKDPR